MEGGAVRRPIPAIALSRCAGRLNTTPTSENSVHTKFAELLFHDVGE
jgi:hypothetical protein